MSESCDEIFMREALVEAENARGSGEVPIGAVLLCEGKIIARGHNGVERGCDASRHAELICLQQGALALSNWRLNLCTLYCTLEPCAMCAGAMILFRLGRLVFGAKDSRHGAIEVLEKPHEIHQVEWAGGVCAEEGRRIVQEFFKERRGKDV